MERKKMADNDVAEVDDELLGDLDQDLDSGDVDYEVEFGCTEEEYNQAVEEGWNPDFKGKNARTAKDFLDRGSFFKKIDSMNKALKERDKRTEQLEEQVKFFADRAAAADTQAREQLQKELLDAKKEALADDDHDRVVEIDEELAVVRDEIKESKKKPAVQKEEEHDGDPSPIYEDWTEGNEWYESDPKLHKVADALAAARIDEVGEPSTPEEAKEILEYVSKEIKATYPSKFKNQNKSKPDTVEGDTKHRRRKASTIKYTVDDLEPDERRIMHNMIDKGQVKSEQDYIDQLATSGFFKDR